MAARARRSVAVTTAFALLSAAMAALAVVAAPPVAAAPGMLDSGFGGTGVVHHDFGGGATTVDQVTAVAVQPDGKVLVAGSAAGGTQAVVQRLLASGAVDPSFGTGGAITFALPGDRVVVRAMQVGPDGKVVLAGSWVAVAGPSATQGFVARLLAPGALDPAFDGDGVRVDLPSGVANTAAVPSAVAVRNDGDVYVVGGLGAAFSTAARLMRLRSDGSVDTTFASGGRLTIDHVVSAMTLSPTDDALLLAGGTVAAAPAMVLTKVTASGAFDTSFGTGGRVVFEHGTSDSESARSVAIGPGGAIYVGGGFVTSGAGPTTGFLVARAAADGAVDAGFGTAGRVRTVAAGPVRSIVVQADGGVVAAGGPLYGGTAAPWVVARYDANGDLDPTFGTGGFGESPSGVDGGATSLAMVDGAAYVTGWTTDNDLTAVRYDIGAASPAFPFAYGTAPIGGAYRPIAPQRVLDTRHGGAAAKLGAGGEVTIRVAGGSVGAGDGATAAVVNVTATEATDAGFVTVWPAGTVRPVVSSLNLPGPDATVANLVTVPVGADGTITIFSQSGAHIVVDVLGHYISTTTMTSSGRFVPIAPTRVLDTRTVGGPPATTAARLDTIAGIAAGNAVAAVVNLTVTEATSAGFVTAWATGAQPGTSNVNVDAIGQTRANQTIVGLHDRGFALANTTGGHLVVDVVGYMTSDAAPLAADGLFVPVPLARVWDTRSGLGTIAAPLGRGEQRDLAAVSGELVASAVAVIGNLTATESFEPGYVTLWPTSGGARPLVSTINLDEAQQTRANHVTMPLGDAGRLSVFAQTGTHVILDVSGTYRR